MRCSSTGSSGSALQQATQITSALLTQGTLVLVILVLLASSAWGYRPFVSTDAAVAERARMEIELGYLVVF